MADQEPPKIQNPPKSTRPVRCSVCRGDHESKFCMVLNGKFEKNDRRQGFKWSCPFHKKASHILDECWDLARYANNPTLLTEYLIQDCVGPAYATQLIHWPDLAQRTLHRVNITNHPWTPEYSIEQWEKNPDKLEKCMKGATVTIEMDPNTSGRAVLRLGYQTTDGKAPRCTLDELPEFVRKRDEEREQKAKAGSESDKQRLKQLKDSVRELEAAMAANNKLISKKGQNLKSDGRREKRKQEKATASKHASTERVAPPVHLSRTSSMSVADRSEDVRMTGTSGNVGSPGQHTQPPRRNPPPSAEASKDKDVRMTGTSGNVGSPAQHPQPPRRNPPQSDEALVDSDEEFMSKFEVISGSLTSETYREIIHGSPKSNT
ncbi:hypothetical protein F4779DRAFT_576784 [Xylariaceae sp. FL0662B]|nr:hypothetical protein F4779DRAFT_576784 [Xylariaceae sp. FL0662B]